jgi:FkbM family methyltransferase
VIGRLLRAYITRFPIARGKGVIVRLVAPRLPESSREFEAEVGQVRMAVRWDEVVGRKLLRTGAFEPSELATVLSIVSPGDVVFDVGANIGLQTCPIAAAVGPDGMVIALEPLPDNVRRLRVNIDRNGLANVRVVEAAAARTDGRATLKLAQDPAFASLHPIDKYATAGELDVPVRSLDSLWQELGRPRVSLVKIDVEGAELDVIEGAAALLDEIHPALLVEADPGERAERVDARLAAIGYRETTPVGFDHENHLYLGRKPKD